MNKELMSKIESDLNEWTIQNELLVKEFVFSTFQDAMNFVNAVAKSADEADHHPDIFISYNKVMIPLSTGVFLHGHKVDQDFTMWMEFL